MVLNKLKQIRDELKTSAVAYDNAFKNTASIAAQELSDRKLNIDKKDTQTEVESNLSKEYFLEQYGSLKNAKLAYQKIYGIQKYGRSWSDFIAVAKQLNTAKVQKSSLEDRITKIENFLQQLGYQP